jgi:two-component system OmpR family response regulator
VRVLLVEDEERLAETVRRGLVAEGFVVRVACDGPSGLALALEESFDVVVLDIMLPGLSGYEVLRGLRRRDTRTPVLMLTAKDGDHEEADALDLGADDYLTKPFSFVVLIARLRALLRRQAPQQARELVVDDLVLDPVRRAARRGDAPLALTPREFGLLEFLMRRAGHAVTKAEILHHVWDPHYTGAENVVEVYVGYLRRKIDLPFGRTTIETVRGVGYRLGG